MAYHHAMFSCGFIESDKLGSDRGTLGHGPGSPDRRRGLPPITVEALPISTIL